jgi:hypothetical protein
MVSLTTLLLGTLAAYSPATSPPAGGPTSVTRLTLSYTQHLAAPPEEVFPLLGPAGEKKWAHDGWAPKFVYPPTGVDEQGCVFTTGGPDGESVWMLTTFDARRRRVEYLEVTPGARVTEIRIALLPEGRDRTAAKVTYTWTALSDAGSRFIAAHRGAVFEQSMAEWETRLNAYLGNLGKE